MRHIHLDVFKDIVGQNKAVSFLENILEHGTASHAYLFTGPDGVGKRTAAISVAAALNCAHDGCGSCPVCVKIRNGAHPDVESIRPAGNSLKIDQIRGIGQSIGLRPFEGARKVYIIEDAHLMTVEAANALLKNLEEPPPYVAFILTAPGADSLLPTIQSRCQEVVFRAVPPRFIQTLLLAEGAAADEAEIAMALSGGSVGKAKRILLGGASGDLRTMILDRAVEIGEGNIIDVFAAKDALALLVKEKDKGEGLSVETEALVILGSWYRDLIVLRETSDVSLLINKDREPQLAQAAERISSDKAAAALDILTRAGAALRTNANKDLVFEEALLAVNSALPTAARLEG